MVTRDPDSLLGETRGPTAANCDLPVAGPGAQRRMAALPAARRVGRAAGLGPLALPAHAAPPDAPVGGLRGGETRAGLGETDLIIDLRAPNFLPYNTFATALIAALRRIGDLTVYRDFVLVSTAIPDNFKEVATGSDEIPRHDWLFYQALLSALPSDLRRPVYGDYTTVHPDFVPRDMRNIKAAGKVIYTTAETWATRKGGAFRDDREQMHTHCGAIVAEAGFQFRGAAFSSGDRYIARCAVRQETPSNLTRWKEVAINHHITVVVDDLAKFGAASSRP